MTWFLWVCLANAADTLVTGTLVLAVAQPDEVADALVAKVVEQGGWFRIRTPHALSLAVPNAAFEELFAHAEQQGLVLDKATSRADRTLQLEELRSRLKAREGMFEAYENVLGGASAEGVLTVEYEMSESIAEIEELRGQIQLLEDKVAHAQLEISFRLRDRTAPPSDEVSSFEWLNTIDLQSMLQRSLNPFSLPARGVSLPSLPEAFALWHDRKGLRALSPEGVVLQVHTARQDPQAPLAFWQEAVREHVVNSGYRVIGEQPLMAHGHEGVLLELAAPLGTQDWLYWVAFFPHGEHVVVAEVAGEASELLAYRQGLITALQDVRF